MISYHDGELHVDGVPVRALARAAGTPLFVYSAELMLARLARLRSAFAALDPRVRYAVKANSNASLMRLLHRAGAGFDLVSGGELLRALRIGADPADLVFAGVGKQDWEIQLALEHGIGMLNVESESELDRVRFLAHAGGHATRLALRVNPDVAVETHPYITTALEKSKFGVDLATAARLVEVIAADARLSLVAYHVHLGSSLLDAAPYVEACRRVLEFVDDDPRRAEGVRFYDLGGGFGSCGPFDAELLDVGALAEGLGDLLRPRGISVLLEPGRFLVGDAGVLVTRVVHEKTGVAKDFCVVDAAMNDLIRPALYGAEHPIQPVVESQGTRPRPVDVVGPVCESADFLGQARDLPPLGRGDLLAVFSAGAYCASMASNYNSRPLAAGVLCGDGPPRLIQRRQPIEELWRDEVDEGLDLSGPGGDPQRQP